MKTLVIDTTINAYTESFSAQLLQQIKQQFAESTTYLPLNDMDLPTLDEATLTVIYKKSRGGFERGGASYRRHSEIDVTAV
ncbi:hypothetical protein [Psychrobacter nivimaris]|nr:hypothetical protein [Psychrobacter nivimaris]